MTIYKITNKINGKIYIGQTSLTLEERFNNHIKKAKLYTNRYLYDAMNHYGYDNFIIEQIDTCTSKRDMDNKEKYWITHYKSNIKKYGYNMTDGGGGGRMLPEVYSIIGKKVSISNTGKKCSEETKQKISLANKGKIMSPEARKKLSDYCKRVGKKPPLTIRLGVDHPMYGKRHTEASKHLMSLSQTSKARHSKEEKEKRRIRFTKENNPKYIEVDKQKLLTFIKNGLNNHDLAKEFKCTTPTIIEKIKKYFKVKPEELRKQLGVSGNRKKEYKIIDYLLLTEFIKSGKLRKDIAKELNISEPQLNLKIKNKYGFGFTCLKQEIKNGNI